MKINFAGLATASTSTQLPAGQYAFEIDSIDADYEARNTGSKALEVKAHVIEGMDFDDGSSTVGLVRTLRFWYPTPNQKDGGKFCLGRLNEFLKACGMDTSDDGFDTDDLPSRRFMCRAKVKVDEQGRDNEEYDRFKEYK